jgi:hypothetical protein
VFRLLLYSVSLVFLLYGKGFSEVRDKFSSGFISPNPLPVTKFVDTFGVSKEEEGRPLSLRLRADNLKLPLKKLLNFFPRINMKLPCFLVFNLPGETNFIEKLKYVCVN